MGFVGNYAPCGLSPQTDGMPVIPREAQLAGPNRTANPLPEIRGFFRLLKLPVSPLKLPFHQPFEILHLPGDLPTGIAFENSEAFFRKPFAEGGCVDLVTLE